MSVDANAEFLEFRNVDKIKFIGTSSNTIIDTTTGRLGIGTDTPAYAIDVRGTANVTALSGITDFNFQPTSNTASIEYDSNVVTGFNRSKKLIRYPRVALTGSTSGGYTASASRENGVRQAYTAFDGDDTTFWQIVNNPDRYDTSGNATSDATLFEGNNGEWIKILLPTKVNISSIRRKATGSTRRPTKCKFYGSNNDTTWHLLEDITFSNTDWADETVNTNNYYNYFVLQVLTVSGNGQNVDMKELELYGLPEYDPDAAGVDVKVTSYPNVPNTDWLEVYYEGKNYTSGNIVQDETENGIDGTFTGITYNTEYNSFDFSGVSSSSKITATLPSTFVGNQPFTVSVWFKRYNDSVDENTIWRIGPRTDEKCLALAVSGGNFNFFGNDSTDGIFSSTTFNNGGYVVGRWYHVACVYDGSSRYIFIDSVRDGTTVTNSLDFNASTELVLGFNGINKYLNGSIANFRLFNRALTSDEIYQLYAYQKEYFGHGELGMTLKAGRLGIGTSEPRALLDVQGPVRIYDTELTNPVYAEFSSNYSSAGFSDEQSVGNWRDPSNNILDFNVVTQQSSHNAFDADSAVSVRGSFTVPVEGLYVIYYAALVNRVSTSSHIYVHVNGSNANGTGINSHQNRNTVGSMWTTITIQRVLRLNRGDKVQCYITGGFFTLSHYSFGSIYQIGA